MLNTLLLIIWSRSLIEFLVANLQIGHAVLICPARLKQDPFRGGRLVASTLTKSIVTIEPNLDDARLLKTSVDASNVVETVQQMLATEIMNRTGDYSAFVQPDLDNITGEWHFNFLNHLSAAA